MPEPALFELPRLLAEDAAVLAVASGRADVVAVAEAARPIFAAAVQRLAGIRPVLVAVPTAAEAERIAGDLVPMLGADAVELFPAWETLPFERVSPALETMGRRLRVMWRLREGGDAAPAVVVAPVRALVQRLGPHVEAIEPIQLRAGDTIERDQLVERLVGMGYRREYQVEGRGEVAVRGSIVDVFPATADHPVRIDQWGDEVERVSEFAVTDQRSTHDIDTVTIFPCRELLPTDEVRARAGELLGSESWGAEQWERLREGQIFDGMESWLPWLTGDEHLLPDLLPPGARVLLVEPRRMRDRAQDLLDEEASLAEVLAGTWGAVDDEFPRLSLPFDRLLARTKVATTSVLAAPDGPDTPQLGASAFDPVVGDIEALAERVRALIRAEHRVVLAAEGEGSARRLADVLAGEGIDARIDAPIHPGVVTVLIAPLERGVIVAGAHLALVAEADLTGRRRVHRTARGARKAVDYYDDLKPSDFVVHQVHGVGRYEGMVTRVDRRGRARLPPHRVPGERQALRSHRSGRHRAALHRWRFAVALAHGRRRVVQDPGQGSGGGAGHRRGARDPVPQAVGDAGVRVQCRHAMAARTRRRLPLRRDAGPTPGDRRSQGRYGGGPADGSAHLR